MRGRLKEQDSSRWFRPPFWLPTVGRSGGCVAGPRRALPTPCVSRHFTARISRGVKGRSSR